MLCELFQLIKQTLSMPIPKFIICTFFMEMYLANTKEFILYFLLFFSFESHGSTPSQSNLNAILTMYPYVSTKFDFQTQSNPLHFVAHLLLWEHFFIIALSLTLPLSLSLSLHCCSCKCSLLQLPSWLTHSLTPFRVRSPALTYFPLSSYACDMQLSNARSLSSLSWICSCASFACISNCK